MLRWETLCVLEVLFVFLSSFFCLAVLATHMEKDLAALGGGVVAIAGEGDLVYVGHQGHFRAGDEGEEGNFLGDRAP